jgi:hypothetical protein
MMIGSGPLAPEDGFRLWCALHYPYGAMIGDVVADDQLRQAFMAGWELAASQSTQGSGEWDPGA